MRIERILILGGTGLAREAANALVPHVTTVVTSLAGVTRTPHLPKSEIRVGGFGGTEGLAAYLRDEKTDLVIDATHPFAAQMSAHAHAACASADVELIRLEAPAWEQQKKDDWRTAGSVAEVVEALPKNAIVAVTVGRKEIGAFFARPDISGIARMIEPPDVAVPKHWQVLLERPPFTQESEIDLLRSYEVAFLVSKNAGGMRVAKLDAAAALGLPVIMIARPFKPVVATVTTIAELLGTLGIAD